MKWLILILLFSCKPLENAYVIDKYTKPSKILIIKEQNLFTKQLEERTIIIPESYYIKIEGIKKHKHKTKIIRVEKQQYDSIKLISKYYEKRIRD